MVTKNELPSVQCQTCGHARALAADECIGANELPRRMSDDEVRFPDGSAQKMVLKTGETRASGECAPFVWAQHHWWPGRPLSDMSKGHPAHEKSQLARLQSFWDKNQPKEAELNLRWGGSGQVCYFDFEGKERGFAGHFGIDWSARMSPSQRATVEAFFAKGPPVELAEEVQINGKRYTMSVVGDELHMMFEGKAGHGPYRYNRASLADHARNYPDPIDWPHALAYFDRHVACTVHHGTDGYCSKCGKREDAHKPEPARVTDVRFAKSTKLAWYTIDGCEYAYGGPWTNKDLSRLHPSDIALIERCWAEGRLGEREVLFDSGVVGTVEPHDARYAIRTGPASVCLLSFNFETKDGDAAWRWSGDHTIHDPTQRARVRAIVAGMQKDLATRTGPEAQAVAAVVTEAHSVTPSGEVKAPWDLASMWETTAMCEGARREQAEAALRVANAATQVQRIRATQAEEANARAMASAPDLTELREAAGTMGPWLREFYPGLVAAVERLVVK